MLGGGGSVTKYIYKCGINPLVLLKIRLIGTTIILFFILGIFVPKCFKIYYKDGIHFVFLGIIGFGGLLMISSYSFSTLNNFGIAIGIMSAILYSFNILKSKSLSKKYKPFTIIFYSFLFASLIYLFVPVSINWQNITIVPLWMYVYVIICYTLLPYSLFYVGVHYLPPTNVAITAAIEPVIAAIIAFITLGELMERLQIIGGVAILTATFIIQIYEIKKELNF